MTEDKFNAKPVYLTPIFASLMMGLACAYLLLRVPPPVIPVTPFPDTTSGALSNALYFVIIITAGATIFYFLLKWKSKKMIVILTSFALTAASVLLSVYYLSLLLSSYPNWEIYVLILTICITILFDFAIFKKGGKTASVVVVVLGGALGVFLGNSIPVWSAILILAFLAIYDIITVYKGPVGKIANSGLDELKGLSYVFKDIQMGLGDLVFYSMLSAVMLLHYGWVSYFASLAGILGGSFFTLLMLERKGIFPGLPIPILLGLSLGLAGSLFPIF